MAERPLDPLHRAIPVVFGLLEEGRPVGCPDLQSHGGRHVLAIPPLALLIRGKLTKCLLLVEDHFFILGPNSVGNMLALTINHFWHLLA